jgi:TM2 domain-containing membrane protein YozV
MAVKDKLTTLDDSKFVYLQSLNLKDPTTILIVSILAGNLGIDRFMIGDTGLGIGKLLTCGGFGIWGIVDWFIIQGRTREVNFARVQTL